MSRSAIIALAATALVAAQAAPGGAARVRCSPDPKVAARTIVPPPPFVARVLVVERKKLPPFEPAGRGPEYKRLYAVTFHAVRGNAILPTGHDYTQFAYVTRRTLSSRWCFVKGGSGP